MADIKNIYGNLSDGTRVILAHGTHNTMYHALVDRHNEIRFETLVAGTDNDVVEFVLKYESPIGTKDNSRLYFSLSTDNGQFLNVTVETIATNNIPYTILSSEKAIFWIDGSIIDSKPRSTLLAGVLYDIKTMFGEQEYTIEWRYKDNTKTSAAFLPLTWYERDEQNVCVQHSGIDELTGKLFTSLHRYKGYSTEKWCREIPSVSNCDTESQCGSCMGMCPNTSHYCVPNSEKVAGFGPFICTSSETAVTSSPPQTTGTVATWIALAAVLIIAVLLTFGLSRK